MIDAESLTVKQRCSFCCKYHWRGIVLLLSLVVFMPLLLFEPVKAMRCAYILCVMATYWITEAIPIYVTALIPIVAMPLMGIMSSNETCMQYMKDLIMFFIVSMMIALAVEHSKLHTRLALSVIGIVGCSPRRLHFSLMAVTMVISFWISNSATTAMMCPIAKAILMQLDEQGLIKFYREEEQASEDNVPFPSNVTISFFLGIAYSASIGGCATLIGSNTNLAIKGLYDARFPQAGDLTFNSFIYFNIMPVLLIFFLTYVWLEVTLMGLFRPTSFTAQELTIGIEGKKEAKELIKQKTAELGKMSTAEIIVGFYFVLMILLLFLRKPDMFPGYANILDEKEIKNSSPTIIVAFLMFITPTIWSFFRFFSCKAPVNDKPIESLMTWSYIHNNMPWGIPILLGGGFALSKGIQESKLAVLIGQNLKMFTRLPNPVLQFCCIAASFCFTAFSANVVVVNIWEPILFEIARIAEVHPLYLVLPAGMACSLAFHLPVSTPPNAIVAGIANIRTKDMAIAGIGPTLISLIVYFIFSQFWGLFLFKNYHTFPEWARSQNVNV